MIPDILSVMTMSHKLDIKQLLLKLAEQQNNLLTFFKLAIQDHFGSAVKHTNKKDLFYKLNLVLYCISELFCKLVKLFFLLI